MYTFYVVTTWHQPQAEISALSSTTIQHDTPSVDVRPAGYNKAWSEVSTSAGGVIIPYLGTIDLTGVRPGKGASFGYSDCLKWGYEGTIKVAAFNATQAVGILGLDATRVRRAVPQAVLTHCPRKYHVGPQARRLCFLSVPGRRTEGAIMECIQRSWCNSGP
jgi:hypothetical protein